ncbi:retrotransposon protein, putative, ty1-copia subclass [Tanacetum coccineum]
MTSDHNSSELGIHDHSNEPSSSKLVPKVVPPANKKATSRQVLELLFHHHITILRSMFEREKLSRNNFNEWLRRLKLVLRVKKKMFIIEQPIPPAHAADSKANVLTEWNAVYDAHNEVACLMLGSMTPELHRHFENCSPYEMVHELKAMFEKQARVESVGLILNGLISDFVGFVRNYNMHNMGKTIGELHAMLIKYEKGLPKKAETPQVMMIKSSKIQKANKKLCKAKGKGKANGKGKDKQVYIPKPKNSKPAAKEHPAKDDTCHHREEVGYWKMNYPVYLAKLLNKQKLVGTSSSSGIFTIELFSFPNKSWVYDTRCATHFCIIKQGFREARKLKQGALYLYVGNGVRAQVEAIGSYDLVLPNGLCFTDYGILVSKNNMFYFNVIPCNGIYEIDMHDLVANDNSIYNVSTKRVKHNLDSTYLWHCRLAHIGKKRIEKLQQEGLLKSTDDESFDQCVSCLSGKMTRKSLPHRPKRATDLLGIIHIDVCVHLDMCQDKVFNNEVENQLGKTIKALRSDQGGEYISQQFKDYLKACGIVQQLTPPYTPQHNGVSERRNRTLLDMVRSMMNFTTLPLSFWDYALESTTRILNMVPTKKVDKTPYELWHRKVPNLSYLKVWGEVSGRTIDLEEIQDEDTSPSKITSKIPMEVEGFEPPQEEVVTPPDGAWTEYVSEGVTS